jgi:hypothetical protein
VANRYTKDTFVRPGSIAFDDGLEKQQISI